MDFILLGENPCSMSHTPADDTKTESDEGDDPVIPAGVIRGIEDIDAENTASKTVLKSVLSS